MRYIFDLDGTLCNNQDGDYENSTPIKERIEYVNSLADAGHTVIVCTARGMGQFSGDRARAEDKYYDVTKRQLDEWGLKYSRLFLGKPAGDIYVDDKGQHADAFFQN